VAGRQSLLAAIAAISALAPAAAAETEAGSGKITYRHQVMGTVVSLVQASADEEGAALAARAVFDELDRIDRLMSSWRDDSDVSRINAAAPGQWVVIDAEVFTVIAAATAVARKTGGAFDITVGSYKGLWKFDEDRDGTIPEPAAVEARRPLVNWRHVGLDKKRRAVRLKKKGQRITLGGIAKGYAVDRAIAILRDRGVANFILQAGGDLYAGGKKADGPWTVGIRDPRGGRRDPFAVTALEDRTFSTSGDYERAVIQGGVRYHHILDPATGRPAVRSRSVTVLAESAMVADMWSTALFVMGADRGLKLVDRTPEIEAVFVDAANEVRASRGIEIAKLGAPLAPGRLIVLRPPTPGI
jgi:FAD:protein FMN transferase